ncbi:uncharacterized protein LOC120698565 isoform X3 [Panicum virgatum]|uniref:uncharacterized protein LOC120698565 isoform X3 n=1 Tax=Panicum virgatum TaxID=38727 RepID=UPI0019D4F506|nr:uncharacterized protein LOC120698565 isoform X3 [Panicum virgatum]
MNSSKRPRNTNPSGGGDGDDGSRTMAAQEDSATSGSRVASPETRERMASSAGCDKSLPSEKHTRGSTVSAAASPGVSAAGSGGVAKEQNSSGSIIIPKLLRPRKLQVKRLCHKAADLSLEDLGPTSVSKPVEETPTTLEQPKSMPAPMEPGVEKTPSTEPVEIEVEKTTGASVDLQSTDQEKVTDIAPEVEQSTHENLQEEPKLPVEGAKLYEEKILEF